MKSAIAKVKRILSANSNILKNGMWLFGDHMITFAGGLFVSIWLARYLEPANYGIYSFAIAMYSIGSSFSHLGLNGVSVKELVNTNNVSESVSTIMGLKLGGSLVSFLFINGYLLISGIEGDKYFIAVVVSFAVLLVPFTVLDNYFDSVVKSKMRIIPRKIGFVLRSLLVVSFIVFSWPFFYLGFIAGSEFLIGVFLITMLYWKYGKGFSFRFNWIKAKALLDQSWPLIISSVGAILYLKMDQIMIVSMVGDEAGGYYGAAVRYTSIFYFLQTIILTSVFPKLVEAHKNNSASYRDTLVKITAGLLCLSFVIICTTYLIGGFFLQATFGMDYIDAEAIIKYHILSLPFVFIGAVFSRWLVIEKLTKFSITRHSLGVVVNLILNLILIPYYEGIGAAIASVISLMFSCVIVLFFDQQLTVFAKILKDAIVYPFLLFKKEF